MSFWVVGFDFNCFIEKIYEFVKPSLHSAECCKVSINNVVACASLNQFSVNRFCILKLALIDQCNSLLFLVGVIRMAQGGLFS